MSAIAELMDAMRALPAEARIECEPIHLFAPGIYVRVLRMPAGTAIVSKIHKTEHFCLALNGRATVVVDGVREEVVGPRLMRTMPGTQRALYIHEDAVWLTMHPVGEGVVLDERDLPALEAKLIAKDFEDPALEGRGKPLIAGAGG